MAALKVRIWPGVADVHDGVSRYTAELIRALGSCEGVRLVDEGEDILHLVAAHRYPADWREAKAAGRKLVVTVHDLIPEHEGLKGEQYGGVAERKAVLDAADAIVAVSQWTKDDVVRTYGIAEEKITVIHNGVRRAEVETWRMVVGEGWPCRGGEGENAVGGGQRRESSFVHQSSLATPRMVTTANRRACAEMKVEEWLKGVDDATFDASLAKLVEEKCAAGEYRFEKDVDIEKGLSAAKAFFKGYSRRIVELSDGRCVYFAPDPKSKLRNTSNAICWAEYAFHAVSSGGDKIPGKDYSYRKYNEYKVINMDLIQPTLEAERCVPVLRKNKPAQDAVKFFGAAHLGGMFDVVVRIDEYGNVNANMTEVTFEASAKRGQKKSPQLVSLTEAIRTVVSHQTATGTYPPNGDNIAFSENKCKGGEEKKVEKVGGGGQSINRLIEYSNNRMIEGEQRKADYLLWVGRRAGYKNFLWFVRAAAPFLWMHPRVRVVCTGGQAFGRKERLLLALLGLARRFEVRQVDEDELAALYRGAYALVMPSRAEGFGLPVVEAMAQGCPMILPRAHVFPEIAGDAALWYPLGGAWEFRACLRRLSDPILRATLAQKGRNQSQEFSWNQCAADLCKVYAALMDKTIPVEAILES